MNRSLLPYNRALLTHVRTSDTLMGVMGTPNPKTEGHIMCHAGAPDTYFAMLVYKAHILQSLSIQPLTPKP